MLTDYTVRGSVRRRPATRENAADDEGAMHAGKRCNDKNGGETRRRYF